MRYGKPQFELTRVYSDGTRETPQIISVAQMPWDTKMERRGFLGVGVGIASLLLLLDGKATAQVAPATTNQTNNVPVKVPVKVLKADMNEINALAISPNGKTLASGSSDIKLWSLPDGKLLSSLEARKVRIDALAINPDGNILASGSWQTVKLWSLPGGKLLNTLAEPFSNIEALVVSPDGRILASGKDSAVKIWSLAEGKLLVTLKGHWGYVDALAISPDGKILVSGGRDKTVKLWSLPDGKLLATLEGHKETVKTLAISLDGKILASGSADATIKLWSLAEGKLLATVEGHQSFITAFVTSPDGKTLISGSGDKTIKIWSFPDGKPLATLEGHKYVVKALAITPDGKTLVSADGSGVIILWDLEKRSFISFLFDPGVNESNAIAYNQYDKITGRTITYTLPCGSPIPPGAVCTCNCVPGTYSPPSPPRTVPSGGGVYCTCNKVCYCIPVPSDRNLKESFEMTDPFLILQRLSELPIKTWNYKRDDAAVRHIGPMAQDFAEAFAVGDDDKHIHPVDAQGVAFAAIQGLYQISKEKQAQTQNLQAQLQQQQEEKKELKARIEALEQLVKSRI